MNDEIVIDIHDTTIEVKSQTGKKVFNLGDVFSINETELSKEYASQASLYAYFAQLSAFADHSVMIKDLSRDQEYARADEACRAELERNNKKYTEAVVKSMILQDVDYDKAYKRHAQAVYDASLLKSIVRALEQRANMLISLGSHLRHEDSMTGMNIRERQFTDSVENAKKIMKDRVK